MVVGGKVELQHGEQIEEKYLVKKRKKFLQRKLLLKTTRNCLNG